MDEYEKIVRELSRKNSSTYFSNYSTEHAEVIIKELFKRAQNNIEIVSGNPKFLLSDKPLKNALSEAATRISQTDNPEGKIKIVSISPLDNDTIMSNDASFKEINDRCGKEIIKYIAAEPVNKKSALPHYILVDNKMLRLEEPHEQTNIVDSAPIKAKACFNDPTFTKGMSMSFDKLFLSLEAAA